MAGIKPDWKQGYCIKPEGTSSAMDGENSFSKYFCTICPKLLVPDWKESAECYTPGTPVAKWWPGGSCTNGCHYTQGIGANLWP